MSTSYRPRNHRCGAKPTGSPTAAPDSAEQFTLPSGYLRHYNLLADAVVQRRVIVGGATAQPAEVQAAAQAGVSGPGQSLPHQELIQKSFGVHDVSSVVAHLDTHAATGAKAMGAEAFATGNHVAFDNAPSLFTAAHEAAHVVQQRAGVSVPDGVGHVGDRYEQHADEVAARVVRNESAEDLLSPFAGGSAAPTSAVQRRIVAEKGGKSLAYVDVMHQLDFLLPEEMLLGECSCDIVALYRKFENVPEEYTVEEVAKKMIAEHAEHSSSGEHYPHPGSTATTSASSSSPARSNEELYGTDCKAWMWTNRKWVALVKTNSGPPPGVGGMDEGNVCDMKNPHSQQLMLYKDAASYLEQTARLVSPDFVTPKDSVDPGPPSGLGGSSRAQATLNSFVQSGIKTPLQLGSTANTSADATKRSGEEISVNVLAPTGDAETAKRVADYATSNAANGAIPIVIEQSGDHANQEPDTAALMQRARDSALAVIRPDQLSSKQQSAVRSSALGGGGEATLEGSIHSSNFVRVLVPVEFRPYFSSSDIARYRIQFVGTRKPESFSYNTPGGRTADVTIAVPDYRSALESILKANPNSIFLTHAIRLGAPNPIGLSAKPTQSTTVDEEEESLC